MSSLILIRGGGDLASGVALRLYRAGLKIVITELPQPLAVRRLVSFSEAVYEGQTSVEGVTARLAANSDDIHAILERNEIPVLIDPDLKILQSSIVNRQSSILVNACMNKRPPEPIPHPALLYIGLGPGFVAGENCSAVIETNRGHTLGRVYWCGAPHPDTGQPDPVHGHQEERILRAPAQGIFAAHAQIGDTIEPGQKIAEVAGQPINAPFKGILRGLIHPGLSVTRGLKIGDLDPRDDPRLCMLVSDKALAVGGGVLEAILSLPEVRNILWD
jgi:xanthine dehydrogenase accessory factor